MVRRIRRIAQPPPPQPALQPVVVVEV